LDDRCVLESPKISKFSSCKSLVKASFLLACKSSLIFIEPILIGREVCSCEVINEVVKDDIEVFGLGS